MLITLDSRWMVGPASFFPFMSQALVKPYPQLRVSAVRPLQNATSMVSSGETAECSA
jgi:hypothetical protein